MPIVEQNGSSPVSAAQIPLPPSPAQSVREDEPTLHRESQPADATGPAEERTRPTLQESWEKLLSAVMKYDDEMVKNWKEDIDTLLVFAGLFSAVVTAFVIESYQWLSEDPADTTVALLTQISMQLNASQTILPERPQFEPDASSIRINCWWFLSLIFSLTSALFGLLCKQWLREQQRDPPTQTPAEALALRQMRRDSFEKWGVSSFLSVLPILLEVALLFFFVGILDLLWARHPIPFALCFVSVMFSAGLYFATTLLPTLALLWKSDQLSYRFMCPYKSPQAWVVYRLLFKVLRAFGKIPSIESYIWTLPRRLIIHILFPAFDWSSFDLRAIRQSGLPLPDSFIFNVYELRTLQWAFTVFQDSPSIVPHLQNVLGTIPPMAISVILRKWKLAIWGDIQQSDFELWFHDRRAFWESLGSYILNTPLPTLRAPTLLHSEGIRLLYYQQQWQAFTSSSNMDLDVFHHFIHSVELHYADLQKLAGLRFIIPFTVVERLWTHADPVIQEQCSQLLCFYEEAFSVHPGYDEKRHDDERLAFISALVKHLDRINFTSYVATSPRGQEFIRLVHNQIITRGLYRPVYNQGLMSDWSRVTQRVTEIGHRPADYFSPIPSFSGESATDAGIPAPGIDYNRTLRVEDETGVSQSDHEIDDDEGGVLGLVGGASADEHV